MLPDDGMPVGHPIILISVDCNPAWVSVESAQRSSGSICKSCYEVQTGPWSWKMRRETIQNLLHKYYPEWDASVLRARIELGFSFSLSPEQCWDWFVGSKHTEVRQRSRSEVEALKLPVESGLYGGLVQYWVCCFYSDYKPTGVVDLKAIKGPPYLVLGCPSSGVGEEWKLSIDKARSELVAEHQFADLYDLAGWFWLGKGAIEVGERALRTVGALGLPESHAMAWLCCFLPNGTKYMAPRSVPVLDRFPQFADWNHFRCSSQPVDSRPRAYPFVVDWAEGADEEYRESTTMWDLTERGMDLGSIIDAAGNIRMSLTWHPDLVGLEDLRMGVAFAQRYYRQTLRTKDHPAPLQKLVDEFGQRAKAGLPEDRVLAAQARYAKSEATFEQLLREEALTPDVQDRYKGYLASCGKNSALRESSLTKIKLLRKEVYDRVRWWLAGTGPIPKVQRRPPWWKEVLPDP